MVTDQEVWIDATFGSWQEPNFPDDVTFSCRVDESRAGLVDRLAASAGHADFYGETLTRERVLQHPELDELWVLIDEVVTTVPETADRVSGETQ